MKKRSNPLSKTIGRTPKSARPAARHAARLPRAATENRLRPARWRLTDTTLENIPIYLYDAPWQSIADQVARSLRPIDFMGRVYNPPTDALNRTLRIMAPGLVCGFQRKLGGLEPAVALPGQLPSPALMHRILVSWTREWGKWEANRQHIPGLTSRVEPLLQELQRRGPAEWRHVSVAQAISGNQSKLRYSIVPSLLAARFVAGGPTRIGHRTIHWRLEQGDRGELNAVSTVQTNVISESSWAYLVRFSLQYQPGSARPWVHVRVICQRYMDKGLISGRRGQRPSILIRLQQPLQSDGEDGFCETLVDFPVSSTGHSFDDDLVVSLLDQTRLKPIVQNPQQILNAPQRFRQEDDDEYLVVFAEGYKPPHPMDSGIAPHDLGAIFNILVKRLSDTMTPGGSLPRLKTARSAQALESWRKTEGKASSDVGKAQIRWRAIQSATGSRHLRLLLVCPEEEANTAAAMRSFLSRLLAPQGWPAEGVLPDELEIVALSTPPNVYRKLALQPFVTTDQLSAADRQKRRATRESNQQRLAQDWHDFLWPYCETQSTPTLAWIVLPQASDYESPHDAIRQACIRAGINSQMMNPIRTPLETLGDMGRHYGSKIATDDFVRLSNAVADLLLRQTGVSGSDRLRGTLQDDYVQAGFSADVAERLTTIGLTILSSNDNAYLRQGSTSVPIAVRVLPSGRTEARLCLSGRTTAWMGYLEAAVELGRTFLRLSPGQRMEASTEATVRFFRDILSEQSVISEPIAQLQPALCFLDAPALRGVWPALRVDQLQSGLLQFGGEQWSEAQFPGLNVVWVRDSDSGLDETPRYVGPNRQQSCLFEDVEGGGQDLKPYFSIGVIPARNGDPDAFRHESDKAQRSAQLVELVPFFGQERKPAAIAAHLLRAAPNWPQGNLQQPYVLHLAKALFEDLRPLLGLIDDSESTE